MARKRMGAGKCLGKDEAPQNLLRKIRATSGRTTHHVRETLKVVYQREAAREWHESASVPCSIKEHSAPALNDAFLAIPCGDNP